MKANLTSKSPVGVGGLGDGQQTSYSLFELGIEIERLERTLEDRGVS